MADEPTTVVQTAPPTPPAEPAITPAPSEPVGAVETARESLLSSVRVLTPSAASATTQKSDSAPTSDPKATPPADPNAPAPTTTPVVEEPKLSPKAHEKFSKLETRAKQAETERDTISKERDDLRTRLTQNEAAIRESEILKQRVEKAERTVSELQAQLRAASIERDPDFKAQYDGGIESRKGELRALAIAAGATEQQFNAAMQSGDEDALAGFRDALKPQQQRAWDAHFTDIERLNFARKEAIQNSDRTWDQLESQRAEQNKALTERVKQENVRLADNTVNQLWEEIPGLKDSQPEVRAHVENVLRDAVSNWPREQLVRELAVAQIRAQVIAAQKSVMDQSTKDIEAKDAKIAELEKKVAEQDAFIKERSSEFPRSEIRGGNGSATNGSGSLLENVRVRIPGQ